MSGRPLTLPLCCCYITDTSQPGISQLLNYWITAPHHAVYHLALQQTETWIQQWDKGNEQWANSWKSYMFTSIYDSSYHEYIVCPYLLLSVRHWTKMCMNIITYTAIMNVYMFFSERFLINPIYVTFISSSSCKCEIMLLLWFSHVSHSMYNKAVYLQCHCNCHSHKNNGNICNILFLKFALCHWLAYTFYMS